MIGFQGRMAGRLATEARESHGEVKLLDRVAVSVSAQLKTKAWPRGVFVARREEWIPHRYIVYRQALHRPVAEIEHGLLL